MLLERITPEEGVDENEDQEVEDVVEVKAEVKEEAMEKTKDEGMVEEMTKAKEAVDAGISRIKSKTIPKEAQTLRYRMLLLRRNRSSQTRLSGKASSGCSVS